MYLAYWLVCGDGYRSSLTVVLNIHEIFVAEFFTQSKTVWMDDLGIRRKIIFIMSWPKIRDFLKRMLNMRLRPIRAC